MASTLLDLVIMTVSSAPGTSTTIPLGAAATVSGVTFLSFAGAGATAGQQVSYSILDTGNSEIGTATYTSSNTTLTNRTPTKSTNGGAAINASSAALVYSALRAEDLNSFIVAGQLLGTATNDNASAGNVGEIITASLSSAAAIALTSGTITNVTSITLSAGDWDITGGGYFVPAGAATSITRWGYSMETSSNTFVQTPENSWIQSVAAVTPGANPCGQPLPTLRVSSSISVTYYLNGVSVFTSSGLSAYGSLRARRAR
jgi:hypothetical protein